MNRRLQYGMVGGGPGAFIGAVHRAALALDGRARLVAGAFSSDPQKSRQQGSALGLDEDRVYGSFEEMAAREAGRIDFVVIVTPNHVHYPAAKAFVERGVHVVCDKPLATTLDDAEALCRLVRAHGVGFYLTHNYAGYPMVKQAREMIAAGALGTIRKVTVAYLQGWLATPIEREGQKQAAWRTDPGLAGAGALGDIGTHAEHLVRYVTGLRPERLFADVTTFVDGRAVDDDASVLLRYEGGARGILTASQVAAGEENDLRLRVYGTKAGLEWRQEAPNMLRLKPLAGPEQILKRGNDYLGNATRAASSLPPGHPEGFYEAFAALYHDALDAIAAQRAGTPLSKIDVPTVEDGAAGVHFIQQALESSRRGEWVDAAYSPPA